MFCTKCGSPMEETDKFCGRCGAMQTQVPTEPECRNVVETEFPDEVVSEQAVTEAETPVEPAAPDLVAPVYEASAQPAAEAKKGLAPAKVAIIAAVGVVAVIAVIGLVLSGLFGGNGGVLEAFANSAQAYSGIGEELNLPDLSKLAEGQEYSQSMSMWLEEFAEMPEIEGFGVRLDADCSVPKRKMDLILTPYYGSVDILDLQLKFDDSELYVGAPALTEETFYMIDTQSMGSELAAMGAGDEFAGIGFNVFDLVELMTSANSDNEKALQELKASFEEFKVQLEISEKGSETVNVNDREIKCEAYDVVISEKAAALLIDGLEKYMNSVDYTSKAMELYESLGMSADVIAQMEVSANAYDEMFAELRGAIEDMEDVTLQVYTNGGYVMSVVYEGEIEGEDADVIVNLGGGESYVDDLSITFAADGEEMVMQSTGNHTGRDGKFTDETVLVIDGETIIESELSYEADSGAFSWEIGVDTLSIALTGTVNVEKDGMTVRVDELGLCDSGVSMGLSIGLEYSIGAYEGSSIEVGESVKLLEMTEDELSAAGDAIMMNAYSLLFDLASEIPALSDMILNAS